MRPVIRLVELLNGFVDSVETDLVVTGLCLDSREVKQGDLFVAMSGACVEGHRFITDAVAAGAIAVLFEASVDTDELADVSVPCLPVIGLKQKLGGIAERFYGAPSQQLFVAGITGTNGKTSCSHFLAQALNGEDAPAVVVGTLGNGFVGSLEQATHTTPDAISLHAMLRRFVDAGAKSLVMEVSSHGLEQGRVNGIAFDLGVFTNLSRDHLDYHGDMDAYGRAKARLFQMPGLKYAVINGDDVFGRRLMSELPEAVEAVLYTLSDDKHDQTKLRGQIVSQGHDGLLLDVQTPWGEGRLHTPLLGRFNASNLLAVLSALLLSGVGFDTALQRLSQLKTVPGRMERLGGEHGKPLVVVDYAHTPDALEQVLMTLREHCAAQLWCVFGCGGDRDKGKRALMGTVASHYADQVVLTDDNPRHEDPAAIIDDISAGIKSDRSIVLRDRADAIRHAVTQAAVDDVVLVAGKGHETYQQVGDEKIPFSDREQVRQALGVAA